VALSSTSRRARASNPMRQPESRMIGNGRRTARSQAPNVGHLAALIGFPIADLHAVLHSRVMPSQCIRAAFALIASLSLAGAMPKPPDNKYVALTASDLRNMVFGHYIRDCEGPVDAGPLIIERDAHFEKITGFGSYDGTYSTHLNTIYFVARHTKPPITFFMRFFKDANGSLFVIDELNRTPFPIHIRPIDSHAHDLTCTHGRPSD